MADEDIDERDPDNTDEDLVPRRHIRDLEAKARKADELAERVSTMERTEAFRSAGLDPNDPKAKYFVKGYEGDLTPDAINAAATEVGLVGQPAQTQAPQPPDLSAYDRLAGASQGAGAPAPASPVDDILAAKTEDEVLAAVERAGGLTTRMLQ